MTWRNRAASRIVDRAVRLAPSATRSWLIAMQHELPHVPPHRQLGFAAGALWFAFTERTIAMKSITVRPLEAAILLGAGLLTLIAAANGIRLFAGHPAVATSFLAISLVWAGVFLATVLEHFRLLVRIACAGGLLMLAIGLATILPTPAFAANTALLRALSLEGVILFAGLLFAASLVQRRAERAH